MTKVKLWNGIPENPERDRWHWFEAVPGMPFAMCWNAERRVYEGAWSRSALPETLSGFAYLGPCFTPSEVQSQLAAARRWALEEAAALIECGCKNRHEVVAQRPNSAARWNLCEHSNCMMIEAAAIRALVEKGGGDA